MKVTLYMATSIDGFVAKPDGDSDWVSIADAQNYSKTISEAGALIVGRKTFDQYPDIFPVKEAVNYVLTTDKTRKSDNPRVVFVTQSPKEIIQQIEDLGHEHVVIGGGSITNGFFVKEDLIDEIIISLHPLFLGKGMPLFEDTQLQKDLELISSDQLEDGLVRLHYKVK